MHKLTLITLVTNLIKLLLKKYSTKHDQRLDCVFPQEIVIPLLISIFFNKILYMHSKIVSLLEICWNSFLA